MEEAKRRKDEGRKAEEERRKAEEARRKETERKSADALGLAVEEITPETAKSFGLSEWKA